MSSWYVYLVRCSDGSLYCGVSTDVPRRVREHNSGKGAKYTRSRLPVELVGSLQAESRSDALKLEYEVKQKPADQKYEFLMRSD